MPSKPDGVCPDHQIEFYGYCPLCLKEKTETMTTNTALPSEGAEKPKEETQEVQGQISISYHVYCPHCSEYLDDHYDKEWFNRTMGEDFPIDNGWDQTFEAICPKCKKEFSIGGFVH